MKLYVRILDYEFRGHWIVDIRSRLDLLMTIIIAIIIEFFGLSVIANNPEILARILGP